MSLLWGTSKSGFMSGGDQSRTSSSTGPLSKKLPLVEKAGTHILSAAAADSFFPLMWHTYSEIEMLDSQVTTKDQRMWKSALLQHQNLLLFRCSSCDSQFGMTHLRTTSLKMTVWKPPSKFRNCSFPRRSFIVLPWAVAMTFTPLCEMLATALASLRVLISSTTITWISHTYLHIAETWIIMVSTCAHVKVLALGWLGLWNPELQSWMEPKKQAMTRGGRLEEKPCKCIAWLRQKQLWAVQSLARLNTLER